MCPMRGRRHDGVSTCSLRALEHVDSLFLCVQPLTFEDVGFYLSAQYYLCLDYIIGKGLHSSICLFTSQNESFHFKAFGQSKTGCVTDPKLVG